MPSPRDGLTGRALFAAVAPRLERAHRERKAELVRERRERHALRERVMGYERLVAHRELQVVRAWSGGRRAYIVTRERKLKHARKLLARALEEADRLGV